MKRLKVYVRGRVGISEITGTLLMIAITLVAGAAVFAWVNSQAAVSENSLGASAADNANYFKESFVLVGVQFYDSLNGGSGSPCAGTPTAQCNQVYIDVYNNGAVGLTIQEISFTTVTSTAPYISVTLTLNSLSSGKYNIAYSCASAGVSTATTTSTTTSQTVTQAISTDSVPPSVFSFTLPSSCTNGGYYINDGASYQIQVVGLYGNTVTQQVTANG